MPASLRRCLRLPVGNFWSLFTTIFPSPLCYGATVVLRPTVLGGLAVVLCGGPVWGQIFCYSQPAANLDLSSLPSAPQTGHTWPANVRESLRRAHFWRAWHPAGDVIRNVSIHVSTKLNTYCTTQKTAGLWDAGTWNPEAQRQVLVHRTIKFYLWRSMIRSPEMESPFRANNEKIVADGAELISWNDQKLCIRVWFHSEISGAMGKRQNSKNANEVEATFHGKASLAGTWHEICGRTVHFQKCKDTMILWYYDTIYHILYPVYYNLTSLPHHIFSFWSWFQSI